MPEVTENYVRIPVSRKKKGAQIVTIVISTSRGIKALYDKKNKQILTYLFSTDKWTMKEAKAWVKSHKKSKAHLVMAENYCLAGDIVKNFDKMKKEAYNKASKLIQD